MVSIFLVNMPFASITAPSLALTLLKSAIDTHFADRASTEVCYLNQDFAIYGGLDFYQSIAGSMEHHSSGLGDWFFRQVAFPHLPNNSDEYFLRYYPRRDEQSMQFKHSIQEQRKQLDAFIDAMIDRYGFDKATIVGCTSMFAQTAASLALMRRIKDRNPAVITVLGGANCESPMGQEIVRNAEQVDFVFSGPGLKNFTQFVRHVLDGQHEQLHRIDGVFSKQNYALIESAPQHQPNDVVLFSAGPSIKAMGEELDINVDVPLDYGPFMQTFKRNFAQYGKKPILYFETSRGCWWGERSHCTFCGLNGSSMNYRSMQPEKAVSLIQSLFAHYPDCDHFESVDNILPKSYLTQVVPFLNAPPDSHIFYEVKADLSEEDIKALAQARITIVQPGIEAIATSTLKLMRKGTSSFRNISFLKDCVMYDVHPTWNLLVGFPGEEEDVYRKYVQDMPALTHLTPPSGVFPVRFDRFSPYFVNAELYGLNLEPYDYYEMTYPFDKEVFKSMAYYFVDRNIDAEYFTRMAEWISPMRQQHAAWMALWRNPDIPQPMLYFKYTDSGTMIYDSRSGTAQEYPISDREYQFLEFISKSKKITDIPVKLGLSEDAFEEAWAWLDERRLLFVEDDRALNLVLPSAPPTNTFYKAHLIKRQQEQDGDSGAGNELKPIARGAHRIKVATSKV